MDYTNETLERIIELSNEIIQVNNAIGQAQALAEAAKADIDEATVRMQDAEDFKTEQKGNKETLSQELNSLIQSPLTTSRLIARRAKR